MGAATDTLPGILAIFNNVAPGREAEFDEWFQLEHLAERIRRTGVPSRAKARGDIGAAALLQFLCHAIGRGS